MYIYDQRACRARYKCWVSRYFLANFYYKIIFIICVHESKCIIIINAIRIERGIDKNLLWCLRGGV